MKKNTEQKTVDKTIPPALRPYHEDCWRLLNASRKTILEAVAASGEAYPPGQVADLISLTQAYRTLFKLLISVQRKPPSDCKQRADLENVFRVAGLEVMRLLGKAGFVSELKLFWGPKTVGVDFDGSACPAEALFRLLEGSLDGLFSALMESEEHRLFVCEYCGKIGPSKRSHKRFCNGSCRKLAARKREREKKVVKMFLTHSILVVS